ncbi:hypothetical protein LOTGIDRAFT_230266 [Lottia gigantea]|uniref:Uncharacterized protein n=1 Tax=Lottia gigantea TaxID=225164 RepID=V4CNL4_LOTGI|nr:hypothetical protein LOTGIDRAFT_230266 [Lottia gigantea]ESP03990.1 hypothetical protein LOTGIDRAFT_230266 [Lottia gigantea]
MDPELHVKFGIEAVQTGGNSDNLPKFRFGVQTIETPTDDEDSDISSDFEAPTTLPHDYSDEDKVDLKELVDPGPYRYNKHTSVAALPCLILLIALGGELLLIITTLSAAFLILLNNEGENRKCVILFVLLFIPVHIYMLVTVFPLLWLSLWNFFLLLAVNGALILTAGWILLQFVSFRKEEPIFCQVIEQLLFTAYPTISVMLTSWVLSTILLLSVIPILQLLLGFVMLQIFLVPVVSSFKLKPEEDEDMNVIQQPIVVVMVTMLLLSPSVLHVLFAIFSPSTSSLFTSKSLIELCFIISLSLFMVTLLSIRQLIEYLGLQYSLVIKMRYISGAAATLLCYPVLQTFGLISHFLPWLPVSIVGFSILGIVLSWKKHKIVAISLMVALTVLMFYWIITLPWQLQYPFIFLHCNKIPISIFYILLGINSVLCLLCIYLSTYGTPELLGFFIVLESLVLVICEVCLQKSDLIKLPIIHATGIATSYMLYRLYMSHKLSQTTAIIGASIHLTKVTSALLDQINPSPITLLSSLLLLCLVFMCLKMFVFENRLNISQSQTLAGLCLLLLSLLVNIKTVISTLGYVLLLEQPSTSILIGLWLLIGGALVLLFTQFHPQQLQQQTENKQQQTENKQIDNDLNKLGLVMLLVSIIVFIIQPDIDLSLYSIFQWCELATMLVFTVILYSNISLNFNYLLLLSSILSICPSIRLVILIIGENWDVISVVVYYISTTILIILLIIYIKIESFIQLSDTYIQYLCICEISSQIMLLIWESFNSSKSTSLLDLPTFKSLLLSSLYLSIILKLLSYKKVPGILPTVSKDEEKVRPLLPIIANTTCFISFILLCLQGPVDGFLHDMWCCGASLIFMCLQKDILLFSNLREYNQNTPTSVAAITALIITTFYRNYTFVTPSLFRYCLKVLELLILPSTVPVYVILWTIMWRHEILSEKTVIFCLPLNAVLLYASTSYTSVVLSLTGIGVGLYMIAYKLPMLPYGSHEYYDK